MNSISTTSTKIDTQNSSFESDVELSDDEVEIIEESGPITKTGFYSSVLLSSKPPTKYPNDGDFKQQNKYPNMESRTSLANSAEERTKYEAETLNSIFSKSILQKKGETDKESINQRIKSFKNRVSPDLSDTPSSKHSSKTKNDKPGSNSKMKSWKLPSNTINPSIQSNSTSQDKRSGQLTKLLYSKQSTSNQQSIKHPDLSFDETLPKENMIRNSGKGKAMSNNAVTNPGKIQPSKTKQTQKDFFDLSKTSSKLQKKQSSTKPKLHSSLDKKRIRTTEQDSPNKKSRVDNYTAAKQIVDPISDDSLTDLSVDELDFPLVPNTPPKHIADILFGDSSEEEIVFKKSGKEREKDVAKTLFGDELQNKSPNIKEAKPSIGIPSVTVSYKKGATQRPTNKNSKAQNKSRVDPIPSEKKNLQTTTHRKESVASDISDSKNVNKSKVVARESTTSLYKNLKEKLANLHNRFKSKAIAPSSSSKDSPKVDTMPNPSNSIPPKNNNLEDKSVASQNLKAPVSIIPPSTVNVMEGSAVDSLKDSTPIVQTNRNEITAKPNITDSTKSTLPESQSSKSPNSEIPNKAIWDHQFSSSHKVIVANGYQPVDTFWNDRNFTSKSGIKKAGPELIDDLHPQSIDLGIKPLHKLQSVKYISLPNALDSTDILDTLSVFHFLSEFSGILFDKRVPFQNYGEFMNSICHPEIHFLPLLELYRNILEGLEGRPVKYLCDVQYRLANFYEKYFGNSEILVQLQEKEFYRFFPDTHVAILTGLIDSFILDLLGNQISKVKTAFRVDNQIFQSHYVKYKLCQFLLLKIQNQGFNLKELEAISPLIMNEITLKVASTQEPPSPQSPSSIPSTPSTVDLDSDNEMEGVKPTSDIPVGIQLESKQAEIVELLEQSSEEYLKSSQFYERRLAAYSKVLREYHLESKKFHLGIDRYGQGYWFIPLNFVPDSNVIPQQPIFGIIKEHNYSDPKKPQRFSTVKDFEDFRLLMISLWGSGLRESNLKDNIQIMLVKLRLEVDFSVSAKHSIVKTINNAFSNFNLWVKDVYTHRTQKLYTGLHLTPFDKYFGPIMKRIVIDFGVFLGFNQQMNNAIEIIQHFPLEYMKKLLLKWHEKYQIFDILPPTALEEFQKLHSISHLANWCLSNVEDAKANRRKSEIPIDMPKESKALSSEEESCLNAQPPLLESSCFDIKEYYKMKLAAFANRNK
ncbi:hypothetical protein HDV04_004520 [Boothiomyces sp. JEL0838]|nr:hypothetical protein HDV04_004520 [Boothiomyces sp. JEL0838]